MTNPSYTHITVILDSSGSMHSILNDTIGGFNAFLKGQKAAPGKATLTQVHFSSGRPDLQPSASPPPPNAPVPGTFWAGGAHGAIGGGCHGGVTMPTIWPPISPSFGAFPYAVLNDFSDIQAVAELTTTTFVPGGGTPLLDSIARGIEETGAKLAAMDEENRPSKVLFVIITDGQENASRQHNRASLLNMIKHQTDVYQWTFMYIGANQDAIAEATSFGIQSGFASNFVCDSASVGSTYNLLNAKVGKFRSAATVAEAVTSVAYTDEERAAVMTGTVATDGSISITTTGTTTGGSSQP